MPRLKKITLKDIKDRPLKELFWKGYMDSCLSEWNINVHRARMIGHVKWNIADIVQDGNDPRSDEEMLDVARWYIEKNVYTDEEWEKYFLPAINEMRAYNNAFVRWLPGYVVRNKKDNRLWIVEYDYAAAFSDSCGGRSRDYTSLSLYEIKGDGCIGGGWCWAEYDDFVCHDAAHTEDNIARIRDYHISHHHVPPLYLNNDMIQMYYQ